jgi:hypothetical protein
MGHANVQTTMRYLHYKSKADAAQRLAAAFADDAPDASTNLPNLQSPCIQIGPVAGR